MQIRKRTHTHTFHCEDCRKPCPGRYHRSTDGKLVCFDCLPKKDVDRYPGWRARV